MRDMLFALAAIPMMVAGQPKPDIIVFDEDDAGSAGYYDASYGFRTLPSTLQLGGPNNPTDKLVVVSTQSYLGSVSGLLRWTSVSGGDWRLFVASPGWATRDASGYDTLVVHVNGPSPIAAADLPRIGLESSTNAQTPQVSMAAYLPSGIDADSTVWQRLAIPLGAFQPFGGFSLAQFKDVNFAQGTADNVQHTIWFDNIRIIVETDTTRPSTPQGLVSRWGDQSVVLHWNPNIELNLLGYNIYRGTSPAGPFAGINSSPVASPGYADRDVSNGVAYYYTVRAMNTVYLEGPASDTVSASPAPFASDDAFLDYVERAAIEYFWYEANPLNGLIRDRNTSLSPASIAAMGFGLSAICNGVERGWIPRAAARDRVLRTLTTLWRTPQGSAASGVIGYRGWFYHWLDMNSATRTWSSELSSVDTGELLAGVLDTKQFFNNTDSLETLIRSLADSIVNRVDWTWMLNGGTTLVLGWYPESGFLPYRWLGYNEAMILYLEAIGANVNPIPATAWSHWTSTYSWQSWYGSDFVAFPPLFGHQTTHCWIDFRSNQDTYMKSKGITYAENTRRATLAQRAYCIQNPGGFPGYGATLWGLTACDGPGTSGYLGYAARGAPPAQNDDGTLAPTAAISSMPFTPTESMAAARAMYAQYRSSLWTPYGFCDAFNLKANWFDPDVIGFDQGTTALMIANYRTGAVWSRMMQNEIVQQGLQRAGFTPTVSVSEAEVTAPRVLTLFPNFPNPFNPQTTIRFALPVPGHTRLIVYDLLGRNVATLFNGFMQAGQHEVTWNATEAASGVYFVQLEFGGRVLANRIILTR